MGARPKWKVTGAKLGCEDASEVAPYLPTPNPTPHTLNACTLEPKPDTLHLIPYTPGC